MSVNNKLFKLEVIESDYLEKDLKPIYYVIDKFDILFLNIYRDTYNISNELFSLIYQRIHEETEYLKYSIKDSLKDLIKIFSRVPASFCDICSDNYNSLLSCKHCNITVHKDCYGILRGIKSKQFVCESCKDNLIFPKCVLCFYENGAMFPFNISNIQLKRVYCHFTCILYNPDLEIQSYGEINMLKNVFNSIECQYCNSNDGAVVKCNEKLCNIKYHVHCGLINTYFSKTSTKTYCKNHYKIDLTNKKSSREPNQDLNYTQEYINKRCSIIPNTYVLDMIISSDLCDLKIDNKIQIVTSIYQYYDIKQKVLEGNSSFNKIDLERVGNWFEKRSLFCLKKSKKHEDCIKIFEISDIKVIKEINGMLEIPIKTVEEYLNYLNIKNKIINKEEELKEEENKLKNIQLIKEMGNRVNVLYCLNSLDVNENKIFKYPVTEDIAPNYFSIIKKPMDFEKIRIKLLNENYNWDEFCEDIELIINNCKIYNKDNKYYINKANHLNKMFIDYINST